jgi:peptidoglycan/LPS O-acetylase OafA/YrhL
LPSYVVFGVSALIISSLPWIEGAEGLGWIDLIHYALFLQNYAPASIGDPAWDYAIGPLWSLAVEEHFYLLLPLVLWMLRKQSQVRLFYLALLMCVFIFVLRCGVSWGLERYEADKLTHFRIDSLLLGVSAQILWREQGLKPLLRVCTHWLTVTLGLVGVLCWCLNFSRSDVPMFQMGFSLIAVSYACLLLAVMRVDEAGRSWGLYCSALAFIGRTSYNTYLWHCMVAVMLYPLWSRIDAILPESGALGYVLMTGIYMISSLLIGLLMTQTIESSFLHLRARFDKWHDSRLEAN